MQADVSELRAAQLGVDTIDVGGAGVNGSVNINESQAGALINAGLHFADNDAHINLAVGSGEGTHLSNSLKELSKLGVDTVTSAAGDALSVDLGGFSAAELGATGGVHLSHVGFAQGLDVTLDVANLSQLNVAAGLASDIKGDNISHVQINLADGNNDGNYQDALNRLLSDGSVSSNLTNGKPNANGDLQHYSVLKADVNELRDAGLSVNTIDVGGSSVNAAVSINETQAQNLINAGLHFASQDNVSLDLSGFTVVDGHINGTQFNNSLKHIQSLGVDAAGHEINNLGIDTVNISGIGNVTDLNELTSTLNASGISHLGIHSSDFETTGTNNSSVNDVIGSHLLKAFEDPDWVTNGVDIKLEIDDRQASANEFLTNAKQSDNLALNKIVQHGIDLLPHEGTQLSNDATWHDLVDVLKSSGLGDVEVESNANLHIGDELSAALYESGMLHALPDANIEIDVAANTKLLSTSLKAMADLGVDKVNYSAEKVFVKLGVTENELSGIHDLFSAFGLDNAGKTPQDQKIFANKAGLVLDQTSAEALGFKYSDVGLPDAADEAKVTGLMQQLSKLGITEVDVVGTNSAEVHVYSISEGTVAQTSTTTTVELLGTSNVHEDIFDQEIKKP